MFARVIKGKQKEYVSIVRGYRDENGKVKQKTVYSLGPVTPKSKESVLAAANKIIAHHQQSEIVNNASDIQEIARKNWGASAIINKLWHKFALEQAISKHNFVQSLKLMLVNRFLAPTSKLATFNKRYNYDDFAEVKLHDIYRALDYLHEHQGEVKEHILNKQKLYGKLDVVFFDVTTLYFESQHSDELRNFGFSKDCKFNETQIVLSLVINSEGRPLTYEIFPGNTFEGETLLPCLRRLQERLAIGRIIIVADRGLGSNSNLTALKEAGFDYIIGTRLRSTSQEVRKQALSHEGYQDLNHTGEYSIKYKFLDNELKQGWIVLWSQKRAQKDAKDRARLIEKADKLVDKGNIADKRGARKYLKTTSKQGDAELDLGKIAQDAEFDGYYSLACSDDSLAPEQIASAYHGLWRIEESFRTMKSFLQIRPLWHWTPKRISGHIMMNFIALVMECDLELTLKAKNIEASCRSIRDAVQAMQYSTLQIGNSLLTSVAPLNSLQNNIINALDIPKLKNSMQKNML